MNSSERIGTIRSLWRYPVKSMLGEELDAVDVGEGGVVGDRAYALRDRETGKVASAKHPRLWPNLLACRAAFVDATRPDDELPPVRIELADGNVVLSDAPRRRASTGADRTRGRQRGAERRARCRRRSVALLRPRCGAGTRRAERLHDRPVSPR